MMCATRLIIDLADDDHCPKESEYNNTKNSNKYGQQETNNETSPPSRIPMDVQWVSSGFPVEIVQWQ